MKLEKLDILIDFDSTCVTHAFPNVGEDIGAQEVLKELVDNGHNLILFTMRCDTQERGYLTEAVQWFQDNKIPLYGVHVNPTQDRWTTSPKAFGHLIIDDIALGIPLTNVYNGRTFYDTYFVDWDAIRKLLIERNII